MKVILALVTFCLFFQIQTGYASNCTDWEIVDGVSCIFLGRSGDVWTRDCEITCQWCGNRPCGNVCDAERICTHPKDDPNSFENFCSKWYRHRGISCLTPGPGGDKWVRACEKLFLPEGTDYCSDENPNFY